MYRNSSWSLEGNRTVGANRSYSIASCRLMSDKDLAITQALPRRRLVRLRLVSGDRVHVSATFSRPERGRTAKSLTEVHLVLVFPVFSRCRLVAAPLPLTQGTLKQPNGGTRAPVTNGLVFTGGLAIPESSRSMKRVPSCSSRLLLLSSASYGQNLDPKSSSLELNKNLAQVLIQLYVCMHACNT